MNISCNWLKQFVDFDLTLTELEETLTMLGIEVEAYTNLAAKFENFVIGEVLTKEKHPNADKLSLCKVNVGTAELQIVCGAPNVATGQKVAVGRVGAVVPSNQIKLEKRKIRDCYSEGMICSRAELTLGDDSDGIWVLPNDAEVGKSLVQYLDIDDVILDVSLTPNKADCLSHLGIARELGVALKQKIHLPQTDLNPATVTNTVTNTVTDKNNVNVSTVRTSDTVKVEVADNNLCPRYVARIVKNVKNGESPDWLKNKLLNVGLRPKNIVVDVTNYVLMDLGHPLHAFDFDKVTGEKLVIKNGFAGTKFVTLDGKERKLDSEMLMICDSEKPIAIAGVMGGQNSEISNETKNVILESAFFNPSSIRKTAKTLGISSDASYRFERGADVDMVIPAINKAAQMLAELADGEILDGFVENYPEPILQREIPFRFHQARKIIGYDIPSDEIKEIFTNLGFGLITWTTKERLMTVVVPNRRVDIFDEIDLIEEVARFFNYNLIEPNYASLIDFQRGVIPPHLKPLPLRSVMRKYLANVGFTEILTPNFIDPNSASLVTNQAITIENPLGEEMSKMRPSMVMSMLKIISFNIRQGNTNLKLFETGKFFLSQNNISNSFIEGIDEREQLVIAISGNDNPRQWGISDRKFDFFDIKGYVEELFSHIKIEKIKIKPIENANNIFDENSAIIFIDKQQIGFVGGVKDDILKRYDIEFPVFLATVDLTTLSDFVISASHFKAISAYPVMKRDLAFIIDEKYSVGEIRKTIIAKGSILLKSVDIFDLYRGKNIASGKRSIGFELTFSSIERTLVDTEIEAELENIISSVEKNFDAELRQQ